MAENDFFKPQLTRKEIKLIKLLRTQPEEQQQDFADRFSRLYDEQKKHIADMAEDNEDEENAFWLNSEYYKNNTESR